MYKRGLAATLVLTTCLFWSSAAEEQHKRAPSGFTGVRGKKSVLAPEYGPEDDEPVSGLQEKRAPSGFMGMRGKKLFSGWEGTQPDGLFKRAPSGFMGMRGKKDAEVTNYDDYVKRAPSGFVGMRGKKDPFEEAMDKRAPMGFVGMRGKKDPDAQWEEKRAPSGFFGMRGKKMPRQSGFFGMRGKKYPYEFRGKFVGVRGKKADEEFRNDLDLTSMGQNLDLNQLMLLLTENDNVWEGNEVEQSE